MFLMKISFSKMNVSANAAPKEGYDFP
jgi:hypothetical protein